MKQSYFLQLSAVTAGLLLSGCISSREMAARHRLACEHYGFTPGTEAYANCLLQLDVGDYGYGHHGRRSVAYEGNLGPRMPPRQP